MIGDKSSLLKIELSKKVSMFNEFYKDFIEGIYELFSIMLDEPVESIWYESISIILGYFQLIIYIIDESVSLFLINNIFN